MKILKALQQIADPETRDKAVANYQAQRKTYRPLGEPDDTIPDALQYGFDWELTPEGYGYWERVHVVLKRMYPPETIQEHEYDETRFD